MELSNYLHCFGLRAVREPVVEASDQELLRHVVDTDIPNDDIELVDGGVDKHGQDVDLRHFALTVLMKDSYHAVRFHNQDAVDRLAVHCDMKNLNCHLEKGVA